MTLLQIVLISIASSSTVGGILIAFSNFLSNRSNEHLRGELAEDLESIRNSFQIERQKLQAILDQRNLVSKAAYEAEFQAIRKTFRAAAEVQQLMETMRPVMEIVNPDETPEQRNERLSQKWKALADAYNGFLSLVESWRPFYTDDLYTAYKRCIRTASTELNQIQLFRADFLRWYEDAEANRKEYSDAYATVILVIRVRMRSLMVA